MEYVIGKLSHKLLFFIMEFVFSSIFTVVFYPLAMQYLNVSLTVYYLLSMFFLAVGGLFFNKAFTYSYMEYGKDHNQITKVHYICMFVAKILAYFVLALSIWFVKKDAFLAIYVPSFLLMGGFIWFICLSGYLNAKDAKEENEDIKIITKIQRKTK